MANSLRNVFHDIAEAIRAKGITGTMKPIEMAQKIGEIQTGGGSQDYGYLTFTAEQDTTLTLNQNGDIEPHKLLKSTDGVNWTKWENPATNGIVLNAGESVYIKADENALCKTALSDNSYNLFSSTGGISCGGDIRSIVKLVAPGDYQYWFLRLFNGCTSLKTAPELPETNLPTMCYQHMFSGCTSLTTAPELPATTLARDCYRYMFNECTSLTTAPELPATTLYNFCYEYMFQNCKSLTTAPELPATTLARQCYSHMFSGCTSLTNAPELPATNLADQCYQHMFSICKSLTTAPELPATTLANYCYSYMFYGCTSLTTAPELPATTLYDWCYQYMFSICTSLTTAPSVLPATTLKYACYERMFKDCTSLTNAPELPATTMGQWCYSGMFSGCTSLKRIKMNASSGRFGDFMFSGCTSLELVDMTGSIGVPELYNVNNFDNTNDTYKIVVPDSLYDTWIAATNWAAIASHIMKQSDWNATHPDDQL